MKILTLHDIHPQSRLGINTLSPHRLKELIRFLTDHYQVVPLSRLHPNSSSSRSVAITFDDAYQSVYRYAYPVLQQFNLTASVFPIAGFIGRHNGWEPSPIAPVVEHMSATELSELHQNGWEIGAHGYYHFPYNTKFGELIPRDLEKTSRKFTEISLPVPETLALPFGIEDGKQITLLQQKFKRILGLGLHENSGVLPRLPVYSFWSDMQLRAQIIRWPQPDTLEQFIFRYIHKGAVLSGNWQYWFRRRKIEYFITFR